MNDSGELEKLPISARQMSLDLHLLVRSVEGGGPLDLNVYVLDIAADREAHVWPITVCIQPSGGPTKETAFDLTPLGAATLRDFLDFLVRTKPWLPELP
jgi:hypothetical protein